MQNRFLTGAPELAEVPQQHRQSTQHAVQGTSLDLQLSRLTPSCYCTCLWRNCLGVSEAHSPSGNLNKPFLLCTTTQNSHCSSPPSPKSLMLVFSDIYPTSTSSGSYSKCYHFRLVFVKTVCHHLGPCSPASILSPTSSFFTYFYSSFLSFGLSCSIILVTNKA